jgi:quaternary ammonium compound-resistance protein SugE
MAWVYLLFAGLFEVGWAVGLKFTAGFTRLVPSLWTIASMIISLGLLGLALKTLPLGTAYAIWTGVGTIGTVIVGILLFRESADVLRLACIALIVAGIAGLKLVSPE